ncbi:MAG TPA: hypothetical protein VHU80_15615 [Polyangiaceae bacterium]|jgi:WD40 repeat protein|nr:hypothetical protein [Polyangiaceae bacterium]
MQLVKDTIAREDVLETLFGALDRNASGWFLVVGGPGTGKTVILQQTCARLEAEVPRSKTLLVQHFAGRRGSQPVEWRRLARELEDQVRKACGLATSREPDLSHTLGKVSSKGRKLVLVVDGLDAVRLDGDWLGKLLPTELPDGIKIVGGFRRTAELQMLEAERPNCVIDLDGASLRESNLRLVRRYWEREQERAQRTGDGTLTKQFVEKAMRVCDGQIQYAVALRDWATNGSGGRPAKDALPGSFSAFLEKAWHDVLSDDRKQSENLELGFGLLCAAREALTRAELMSATGFSPRTCDDFLNAARALLREEEGSNPPAYTVYHEALREFLTTDYFATLAPYHERLLAVCKGFDGVWNEERDECVASDARAFVARNYVHHLLAVSRVKDAWRLCTDLEFLVWAASIAGVRSIHESIGATMMASSMLDKRRRTEIAGVLSQHLFRLSRGDAAELEFSLPSVVFNGLAGSSWTEQEILDVFGFGRLLPSLRLRRPAQSTIGWKYAFSFSRSGIIDMAVLGNAAMVGLLDGEGTLTHCCLETGKRQVSVAYRMNRPRLAAIAHETSDILAVSSDNEVLLRRPVDHRATVLGRHGAVIDLCAIDPAGSVGATADEGGTLQIWDLRRGLLRRTWTADRRPTALAIGRSGCVIVGCERGAIAVLRKNVDDDTHLSGDFAAHAIAVDREEKMIAVGRRHGELTTLSLQDGQVRRTWKAHLGSVYACAFSEDGSVIMSGGGDRAVALWDRDGHKKRRLRGHLTRVVRVSATHDRGHIVSAGSNGTLLAWDAQAVLGSREPSPWLTCRVVRPSQLENGNGTPPLACIASVSEDGQLHLWSTTKTGVERKTVGVPQFYTCALSANGGTVAGGTEDGHILRFDVQTGEPRPSLLAAHTGRVLHVEWCPGSDVVASTGEDRRIVISSSAGKARVLVGHSAEVRTCAFVPTSHGTVLVSASASREVCVWDFQSGRRTTHWRPRSAVTTCRCLSDNTVGFTCEDGTFILWRLDQEPETIFGQRGTALDFSPVGIGRHVLTADQDESLSVWNLEAKTCIGKVFGPAIVRCVDAADDLVVAGDAMGNFFISEFVAPMASQSAVESRPARR